MRIKIQRVVINRAHYSHKKYNDLSVKKFSSSKLKGFEEYLFRSWYTEKKEGNITKPKRVSWTYKRFCTMYETQKRFRTQYGT